MKTISIANQPSFVGKVLDINAIPAEQMAANEVFGKPSTRLFVGDVLDFDAALTCFERLDRDGKEIPTSAGPNLIGVTMKCEVTAGGQSRNIVLDMQNILRLCKNQIQGDLGQCGVKADDSLVTRAKAFSAWLTANPTKKLKVTEIGKDPLRKKDGTIIEIDVPSFKIV